MPAPCSHFNTSSAKCGSPLCGGMTITIQADVYLTTNVLSTQGPSWPTATAPGLVPPCDATFDFGFNSGRRSAAPPGMASKAPPTKAAPPQRQRRPKPRPAPSAGPEHVLNASLPQPTVLNSTAKLQAPATTSAGPVQAQVSAASQAPSRPAGTAAQPSPTINPAADALPPMFAGLHHARGRQLIRPAHLRPRGAKNIREAQLAGFVATAGGADLRYGGSKISDILHRTQQASASTGVYGGKVSEKLERSGNGGLYMVASCRKARHNADPVACNISATLGQPSTLQGRLSAPNPEQTALLLALSKQAKP